MEDLILEHRDKGKSKNNETQSKRTLGNDPQYFGAYLNMARHNIFTINNHLVKKLKLQDTLVLSDEESIPDSFLVKKIKEKPNLLFTQLIRFLPIAKVFNPELLPKEEQEKEKEENIDFKSLADTLKICFGELNKFRNDYTHYYSKTNGLDRKIIIDENLAVFLRINKTRAIEYTKKRFKDIFEDKHFIITEKKELVDQSSKITQDGLVFFICLFLDRENAFQFINRIIGFKDTRTPEYKATREVFSSFCVNLPHDKFISDDPVQAFILDMLNELNRCPLELYNNITKKEKKQFQPDISDKISNIEENSIPEEISVDKYEEYIQNITTKIRRKDRFPYFALKYLDMKDDYQLKFHINLGKALLDTHKKLCLGKEENREIVEDVKIFGKLKDFENEDKIIKNIDKKKKMEFKQFNPHFHIENNKIGFSFNLKSCSIKYGLSEKPNLKLSIPDGFLSINELPKVLLLELLKKGKSIEIIKSFLNTNRENILNKEFIERVKEDLVFEKSFYRSFQKKKEPAYSEKALSILKDRKTKLNSLLRQHNLNDKQIPARILNYWLDIKPVKEEMSIANKIKAMKKDCIDRLKAKKKNKAPKVGEMATYLAHDIVDMIIDEKLKNKITSFYYDKMQECLALFSDEEKKQLFLQICEKELNLFDEKKGHPFLKELDLYNINKTSDIYEKYLEKKGNNMKTLKNEKQQKSYQSDTSWLYTTFYVKSKNPTTNKWETKVNLPPDLSKLPFSIRNLLRKKSNFEQWLKNVTDGYSDNDKPKPVDLPTNLFDDILVTILREKLKEGNKLFDTKDKFSKLFELYFGETQPYYYAEREYNVYKEPIKFKLGTQNKFKKYFQEIIDKVSRNQESKRNEERKTNKILPPIEKKDILNVFNKAITENEKIIRFCQTKDRIIFLIIKELLKSDKEIEIKLKDIYPLSEKSPLNHTEKIEQKIKGKLSYGENGGYIKEESQRPEIEKTITDKRKLKDYTVFKKFIPDKRLPELFEYFKEDIIEYSILERELSEYNRCKEFVFDKVFELEKNVIEKPNALEEMNTGYITNIPNETYLNWLISKKIIDENMKLFIKIIRNSFSHNQFPPMRIIQKFVKLNENECISKQILEKYKNEIDSILEKIIKY
jgi:hypothetical protein